MDVEEGWMWMEHGGCGGRVVDVEGHVAVRWMLAWPAGRGPDGKPLGATIELSKPTMPSAMIIIPASWVRSVSV